MAPRGARSEEGRAKESTEELFEEHRMGELATWVTIGRKVARGKNVGSNVDLLLHEGPSQGRTGRSRVKLSEPRS